MTLYSIGVFLVPLGIGSVIVHLLWQDSDPKAALLKFGLGIGVGLGLTSLLYFVYLIFFAGRNGFFTIMLCLLAILVFAASRNFDFRRLSIPRLNLTWVQSILLAALIGSTVLAAGTVVNMNRARPHGGFDAWLIWNRASRFIYRGGEEWKTAFSPEFYFFFQADYPLFVPLTNAWVWETMNTETLRVPFIQTSIYLFGSVFLIFSAMHFSRSLGQATLAAIVLLGTTTYISVGSAQMADTPLALLILAVTILFHSFSKTRDTNLSAVTGFTVGLCGWAKNEGIIFIILGSLSFYFLLIQERNKAQEISRYLAGLVLPLIIIAYFKLSLAPSNYLTEGGLQETLQHLTDLSRYSIIGRAILGELRSFAGWFYAIPMFILYYFGMNKQDNYGSRWRVTSIAMLSLQILSYIAVYVITPRPLEFQLAHSLDRILLHVYPAFLFVLFSSTVTPETLFSPSKIETQGLQSGN